MGTEILLLSVARSGQGLDLAGLRLDGGGWMRLLSSEDDGALLEKQYMLANLWEPRIWDVLEVEAPWAATRRAGQEWRMCNERQFRLLERPVGARHDFGWEEYLEPGPDLLGDCERRLRGPGGGRDRTITLVRPDGLAFRKLYDTDWNRYKYRAVFSLRGQDYELPLTDRAWRRRMEESPEGDHRLEDFGVRAEHGLVLAVSLGEAMKGWRYKMVSGVAEVPAAVARWRFRRRALRLAAGV